MQRLQARCLRLISSLLIPALALSPVGVDAQAAQCAATARPPLTLPATIPFALRGNHVVLGVCRGETPLNFTLDTGAGSSIFDLTTARSLGIETRDTFRAGGAGAGTIAAAQIARDSVFIAGTSIKVPITVAMDFSVINRVSAGSLQGIVGADFMNRYIVALDYRKGEMRLHDRDAFTYSGSGVSVPIRIVNSFIRINVDVVLADGTRVPADCVVDVGSSLSLALAKPFVNGNQLRTRVGPTIRRPSGQGVGGPTDAEIGRVAELNIGGIAIPQVTTYLHGDSAGVFSNSSLGDGNIGGDILRRFTVYFDYRGRRMIFEKHEGTNEPFEIDMSGLRIVPNANNAGLLIEYVMPASPAAAAGLVNGDVITAVDGQSVNGQSLDGTRKKFTAHGATVSVTVRRNGADTVVRIVNKRMV